ncbi:MAG: hypothetical protein HQK53_18015 [Oligoflexia bacterium]|nr:hypothetical protein [Oligoflexia bacterium]
MSLCICRKVFSTILSTIAILTILAVFPTVGYCNQTKYCNGQQITDIVGRYNHPNGKPIMDVLKRPLYPNGAEIKTASGEFNYIKGNNGFEYMINELSNEISYRVNIGGYIIHYKVELGTGHVISLQCGYYVDKGVTFF